MALQKGKVRPAAFFHGSRKLKLVVHGDDFVVEGPVDQLEALRDELASFFEIKHEILGRRPGDVQQLRVLNRVITLEECSITWEADPRHLEVLKESLGMKDAKGLKVPGTVENQETEKGKEKACKKIKMRECQGGNPDDGERVQEDDPEDFDEDDVAAITVEDQAAKFCKGDRVHVARHGVGVVAGVGCCGFKGKVEVCYPGNTRFHCLPEALELIKTPECQYVKCRTCDIWKRPEVQRVMCEDETPVDAVDSACEMVKAGWVPLGTGQWMQQLKGAVCFPPMPASGVTRRTTRDLGTGKLVEDLWLKPSTPQRLIKRQFKEPVDIEVRLETGVEYEDKGEGWKSEPMSPADCSLFRAATARLNFLALDRPDVQYSSKECSRKMANPVNRDWEPVRRLVRYLIENPRMVMQYEFQDTVKQIDGYCDSNWAGCRTTRRSTSGASLMAGKHLLKSYSKTQATVAMSSAEGELYAMVTAASESLGLKAMARDFGVELDVWLWVDASAAIGIARRKGLGKIRHIETQALWVQDAVRQRRVNLKKVDGKLNPSDIHTKYLDMQTMERHLKFMRVQRRQGRPGVAPEMVSGELVPTGEGVDGVEPGGEGAEKKMDVKEVEKAIAKKRRGRRLKEARRWWSDSRDDALEADIDLVNIELGDIELSELRGRECHVNLLEVYRKELDVDPADFYGEGQA